MGFRGPSRSNKEVKSGNPLDLLHRRYRYFLESRSLTLEQPQARDNIDPTSLFLQGFQPRNRHQTRWRPICVGGWGCTSWLSLPEESSIDGDGANHVEMEECWRASI
jgi:hypothetical protein